MTRLLLLLLVASSVEAGFRKALASGNQSFLLLRDDGVVLTFGECPFGRGTASTCAFVPQPVPVPLPGPAIDIAVGEATGFAVLENGAVYSWGSDEYFMLGRAVLGLKRSNGASSPTPAAIPGLPKAVQVIATNQAAAVITEQGELWMWGTLYGPSQGATQRSEFPKRIEGLPSIQGFALNHRDYGHMIHNIALGQDGSVWTWGANPLGQLGNGNTTPTPTPARINLPPAVAVAAGGNGGAAVLADGTVRAWGGNDSSTLGNGQNVQGSQQPNPLPVAGITSATLISAGYGHLIAVMRNGTMRTWGHDGWGQAGIGTSGGYQMRPAAPKLTGVVAAYATRNRCFAITEDGRLWFWGVGYYKLPGPMKADKKIPTDITSLW